MTICLCDQDTDPTDSSGIKVSSWNAEGTLKEVHASQVKIVGKEGTKINILTDNQFCKGDSGSGVIKKNDHYSCLVGIVTESIKGKLCSPSADALSLLTVEMRKHINTYIRT